jgi:hypothetical protein
VRQLGKIGGQNREELEGKLFPDVKKSATLLGVERNIPMGCW